MKQYFQSKFHGKVKYEQSLKGNSVSQAASQEKSVSERRNSKVKSSMCESTPFMHSRSNMEGSVSRDDQLRGEDLGDETRDNGRRQIMQSLRAIVQTLAFQSELLRD